MFDRILIANRGEIAIRIIRACRKLGIESVVVYSQADTTSMHVKLANAAICIGPAPSAQSYLNANAVLAAAEIADVDAIHPGYGFLSENPSFAEKCHSCRIEFIGPSVDAMTQVGDKTLAKKLASSAGVPVVPGSEGAIENLDRAAELAREIGYPVIIKAAAGGGGRGMRVAHNEATLASSWISAQMEAQAAFGNGALYIEKLIQNFRHIEIQILGDLHGNIVHLYERDCTVQRRHQKLIEEAPSPILKKSERESLGKAAVALARKAGYYGAGTVEFLFDIDTRKFYFIEVNARIQVEHPVTEVLTGIDLVEWQIRVAAGERLGFKQGDIELKGASMECRINAENPARHFQPCPGRIQLYYPPASEHVRLDSHIYSGYEIPPYYDSLLGKLIVRGRDRDEVLKRMSGALDDFIIEGVATTIPFLQAILRNDTFVKSRHNNHFVEQSLGAS